DVCRSAPPVRVLARRLHEALVRRERAQPEQRAVLVREREAAPLLGRERRGDGGVEERDALIVVEELSTLLAVARERRERDVGRRRIDREHALEIGLRGPRGGGRGGAGAG